MQITQWEVFGAIGFAVIGAGLYRGVKNADIRPIAVGGVLGGAMLWYAREQKIKMIERQKREEAKKLEATKS